MEKRLDSLTEWQFTLLIYVITASVGLFLSLPALSYPFFVDDFHLIRPYSNQELLDGFTGNYDPSEIGNAGWRPLTPLYYHAEAVLFGENVAGYRLLAVFMFALHVTLLMRVARELRLSRMIVLAAALILVCTKNTWWQFIYITDSLRPFMGLLGSLAMIALIRHLKNPRWWKFALAIIFYALALLTREEILFYAALIPAIGWLYLLQRDDVLTQPKRWFSVSGFRTVVIYAVLAFVLLGVFWLLRGRLVETASTGLDLFGMLYHLILVLFPHLPTPTLIASMILIGVFWLILVVMLRAVDGRTRLIAAFWLGCVVVACTPGLNVYRANNLMLPIGFFSLFVATLVVTFARRSRRAAWACVLILAIFIGGSAYQRRVAQESVHPRSLEYMRLLRFYLWDHFAPAEIPQVRKDAIWSLYHSLGIYTPEDYDVIIPQLYAEAAAAGRYRPDGDEWFIPVYASYLHGW